VGGGGGGGGEGGLVVRGLVCRAGQQVADGQVLLRVEEFSGQAGK